jgi:squalene cyclase
MRPPMSGYRLDEAIALASSFLCRGRSDDQLWRDFHTLAGASLDWVTGFVSYACAASDQVQESVQSALNRLLFRQRPSGGWSYNEIVPSDCDSTAWVLLAISTAQSWRPSAVMRGVRYLKAHQEQSTGGFSTYSIHDGIDRFTGVPDPGWTAGWLSAHPCVTGAAVQALLLHREPPESSAIQAACDYLLKEQEASGLWRSYWWKGTAYPTYQALRALAMSRRLKNEMDKAVSSLLSRQNEDGGWASREGDSEAFETAFSMLSVMLAPTMSTIHSARRAVSWLLDTQSDDGSWPSVPILRIPPPMIRDAEAFGPWRVDEDGTGVIISDGAHLFTSAAVVWALCVFRQVFTAGRVDRTPRLYLRPATGGGSPAHT